jgi:hypothetical protein
MARYFIETERLEGNNYGKCRVMRPIERFVQYVDYSLTVDIKLKFLEFIMD